MRVRFVLRLVSAGLGTGAWLYWLTAATRQEAPRTLFLLWLAALVLWGIALFSTWEVSRWNRSTNCALVIIAFALLPRLLGLANVPYNVTLDEISYPYYGLQHFEERPWEIVSGGHEQYLTYFGEAVQTWPCLFSSPLLGGRIATAVVALLSLLSTYVLGARLFGRWVGLFALLVLGSSYWHMTYARMAYPYMQPILALPLTLHVLLRGVTTRHRFLQFFGGVLLGVSVLLYTPARIVVPVFVLWFGHCLLMGKLGRRESLRSAAVIALGAVLFVSPYLQSQGLRGLFSRYQGTAMAENGPLFLLRTQGWISAGGLQMLAKQVRAAAGVYYKGAGWLAVHDPSPVPLLDPVSLGLALLGLALACVRLRDSKHFLLVSWIAATFVFGQVLTDIPISAYRAAPLLPAVALCAALAGRALTDALTRWLPRYTAALRVAAPVAVTAIILPMNVRGLQTYMAARDRSPLVGMSRLVGAGPTTPIYYLVTSRPLAESETFRFLGRGRIMRDVPSVMDALGRTIDPSRPAVFVLDPFMTAAATAIRRCYPAALWWRGPYPEGREPVMALYASAEAVAAGRACTLLEDGPGVRARYVRGGDWEGSVQRERIEDWPLRWNTAEDAAHFGSVEWLGFLRVPVDGLYRFDLHAEGAQASASVGSQVQLAVDKESAVQLTAGLYPLRVRCQTKPGSFCWRLWNPPGGDFSIIPPEFLIPSRGPTSD